MPGKKTAKDSSKRPTGPTQKKTSSSTGEQSLISSTTEISSSAKSEGDHRSQALRLPGHHARHSPLPLFAVPLPHNISSGKRFLLRHFADQIANEMVVIDGPHNGWRHLILPVALTDETLMDAVLAVSAFHRSLNASNTSNNHHKMTGHQSDPFSGAEPRGLYTRAIVRLKSRGFHESDAQNRHTILLTILVLLTSAMVTGDSDFTILCRLLQSAVEAMGGEEAIGGGELGEFINRQTHKLLTYAAPLLSEESGLAIMSSPDRRLEAFDCLNHCIRQHPEHEEAVSLVVDLISQAQDIYLNQFQQDHTLLAHDQPLASVFRVQKFIDTVGRFPDDSPGEQVLVWASFIAASACVLDEHKSFFQGYLFQHYMRSGFLNLVKALEHLRLIWARNPAERWTRLLPRAGIFIM